MVSLLLVTKEGLRTEIILKAYFQTISTRAILKEEEFIMGLYKESVGNLLVLRRGRNYCHTNL